MKKVNYLMWVIATLTLMTACNQITYKKTKSGLVYKIFPGSGKDSLIQNGQIVKFLLTTKLNDSVIYSNFGKLPGYAKVMPVEPPPYNLIEILPLMKKGDSAVTIQMVDSLIKRSEQFPPYAKKGDRLSISFRIVDVFSADSSANIDYNAEVEKDRPRAMKEQEEQMAQMEKERIEQQKKDEIEMEKSGEIGKELQEMESYLATQKIQAQKTGKGTYVYIKQQGTGPEAAAGKYVRVKYTGKILETDSVFQSNVYAFQLGKGNVIAGWDEGLQLFKEGGKGTLFIPGFLSYGKNPPPNSPFKPFQSLKFDVEMLNVSDTVLENGR
ncbi:MAG: FKBP-type peptidyl-prolyl cis-trans isomerase [Bacteroidia bacterium]|nr:FKBP-type peptidyl-prolyl cis-trans isomerase [Bacteroidia bacterium]